MDMKQPTATAGRLPSARSLGAILVDAGRLTPLQAGRVLQVAQQDGIRFGEAARELGFLDARDIMFALSRQFEYAYLEAGDPAVSPEVLAAFGSRHPLVERLRDVRSRVMQYWQEEKPARKSLALVSVRRGEGKSFIAANLAVLFSQLGQRTLLVDADLAHPRQHRLFRLDNRIGLSSALSGLAELDAAAAFPGLAGLAVLPAGPTPPNPRELLSRPAFAQLLEEAGQIFDAVVMDTPAAALAADGQIIASRAGAALLVSRPHAATVADTASLANALGNLLGAVVNEF